MYLIKVKNGKNRIYNFRKKLQEMGLLYNFDGKCYEMRLNDKNEFQSIIKYCKKHKLKYIIINSEIKRDYNYRKIFFDSNEKEKYRCAYCGKIFRKDSITVDHIFPIDKTSKSDFLQRLMIFLNIYDINSIKNLCAACNRCNSKKGSRTGRWILKGFLGKSENLWIVRKSIQFTFLLFVLSVTLSTLVLLILK